MGSTSSSVEYSDESDSLSAALLELWSSHTDRHSLTGRLALPSNWIKSDILDNRLE